MFMGEENVLNKNYGKKGDIVFKSSTFFVSFIVFKIIKYKGATMPELLRCAGIF
jgi:hypothetical protein